MAVAIKVQFIECWETQYLAFVVGSPYIRPCSRSRTAEPTESTTVCGLGAGKVGVVAGVVVGAATTFRTTLRLACPTPLGRKVTLARVSDARLDAFAAVESGAATLSAGADEPVADSEERVAPGWEERGRSLLAAGLDDDA
ncbi:hypothetical protein MAIC_40660 [Mycolicibacterium aichiense]|uniref:Uncharacterized protein n=1 Tax=Mycolicibacterium aichiense TaxID=1799 RepID=A0AAD1HRD5_9MYCO|nr:hypothetical protein MAIC_40660 [Mycolicibacterium aichiense]